MTGGVHNATGTPLAGVHVVLHGLAGSEATTDSQGVFRITAPPGDYQLSASVRGYGPASIDLKLDHDSHVDVALEALDAPTLHTIASVTVDGRLAPERGSVPSTTVSRADFERLGENRIVQGLMQIPSTTFSRPDGGGSNSIAVVSLRGPDPSETLVALDGQLLNDGNTGDLDVARLPVAAFTAADVTEGLGPQNSDGSNTIGGALDLISLRPTKDPHAAFSVAAGSYGQNEAWINATGTRDKLGYALALDSQHEAGYVNEARQLNVSASPSPLTPLGSSVAARSGVANLTWSFSQNADVSARVFLLDDVRDQSSSINGLSAGSLVGPGSQTFAQNLRAYQVRARSQFGSGELTTEISANDDSVSIDGAVSSPMYDVIHTDTRSNAALTWQRSFENSEYAVGGYSRYESLRFVDPSGSYTPLGQHISSYFVRAGWQPSKELQLNAALYSSRYSTFGSNLDGRIGAILNVSPATAFRFSAGTGFRAPLLIELYPFPVSQLLPDGNGVYQGQGNPSERPEHATEYELGVSHRFSNDSTFDVSLYRTDLRDPIENFYPLAFAGSGGCLANLNPSPPTPPDPRCFSFPTNVGNVVYEGAEVRFVQRFVPQHLFLTARYGLNVAYPLNLSSSISNPTSGGNLVNNEQFLGIAQQQGSLGLDYAKGNVHASLAGTFRGNNNEFHQGPLAIVNCAVGVLVSKSTDITVAGSNLFNDGAGRYTIFGGGVPYRGVVSQDAQGNPVYGPLPTNRYVTEPFSVKILVTVRS
ncbi:MAG: TonB-dependent receptor [Candidatus Eremiobacteraeota bacterium]|nr:TonB-dependent receptor [Candidatus Eremiobacteraeota bacterium]